MRREKFCLSFSRFAQASAAALITLTLAGAARADTIKEFMSPVLPRMYRE